MKGNAAFTASREIWKNDMTAIGTQMIDIVSILFSHEPGDLDYSFVEGISWFFKCITKRMDEAYIEDMKNGLGQDFIGKVVNKFLAFAIRRTDG